jgi:hypothetical protein
MMPFTHSPSCVGLDKFRRPTDRTVNVAFRGEIDDGVRLVLAQQPAHRFTVTDSGAHS